MQQTKQLVGQREDFQKPVTTLGQPRHTSGMPPLGLALPRVNRTRSLACQSINTVPLLGPGLCCPGLGTQQGTRQKEPLPWETLLSRAREKVDLNSRDFGEEMETGRKTAGRGGQGQP